MDSLDPALLQEDLTDVKEEASDMSPLAPSDGTMSPHACDDVRGLTVDPSDLPVTDQDSDPTGISNGSGVSASESGETTSDIVTTCSSSVIDSDSVAVDAISNAIPVTSEQVIGLLLQANENDGVSADVSQAQQISVAMSLSEATMVTTNAGQAMQAITLADGTTAFIQHPKDGKFLEGQTVTLEDGTTAVVQGITEKVDANEASGNKLIDGQAIQLEDGTTAYLQQTPKAAVAEGLQAIQLEDGTTAYITHPTAETLFGEAGSLASTSLTLDQLTSQTVISGGNRLTDKALAIGEKAYRCGYNGCGRLYTTLHHLKVHERSHTGDRPFKCDFTGCGKAFATGYGLKSHTRVHTGEKPYPCPEEACDKAFKTSGDLQKHVRTHTGERPFKCPFEGCNRSFTTSNIRKVHIRTHTGERPYVCQVEGCNRAFASATNYKNHIRIHTGEKPYVCTVQGCGKRFTEYSSLYKHHVVHTHSKPYICNHCGKTYRQTSTLAMHKRTAHGEDVTPESEAQMFAEHEGDSSEESPAKRPRLQFALASSDPTTGQEEGEGTLVINTTDAQQVGQVAMVTSDGVRVVTEDQAMGMVTLQAPTQMTLQQIQQAQGITSITVGDQGQQVLVVTDPSQLEALQQLAQQQHFDTNSIDQTTVSSDNAAADAIIVSSEEATTTDTAMITFHSE